MSDPIIVAFITGSMTLVGTIITVLMASRKTDEALRVSQAVTDTKIEELTREVREHNEFGRRIPVIEEQMKVVNHRIEDLEDKLK